MKPELRETADGSHTLFVPELNETYHSVHGAITESQHVFINAGLLCIKNPQDKIRILEIGFGTGLNALLTWIEAEKNAFNISYTTLEPFPLHENIIQALNFSDVLQIEGRNTKFQTLHTSPFEKEIQLSENFSLLKQNTTLENFQAHSDFHLIYFDAFGPRVQPEIWSLENFTTLFLCLHKDGILVTYCAKGDVRRTMLAAGFRVEKRNGPPGKREMLRAYRN